MSVPTYTTYTVLEQLNPVSFNYKSYKEEEHLGFISEDVPEMVATNGGYKG